LQFLFIISSYHEEGKYIAAASAIALIVRGLPTVARARRTIHLNRLFHGQ